MRVVITSATGDAGVVVARCLRRAGFEVLGIDARRIPRALASRYLSGYMCVDHVDPLARQGAMLRFIERSRADVFLPLCTPGAMMAACRSNELESLCRSCVTGRDAFLAAYDKRRCMEECISLGIPCAGMLSRDEATALLKAGGRSVVVKPAVDAGAARCVSFVSTIEELDDAIAQCAHGHGGYLLQDHIPGSADAMHTVIVVMSESSQLVGAFTARKLLHWPPTGGVTACGTSTRRTDLLDLVMPFFRRWRWRGPAEVELKRDDRDGQYKVIEINPRFPGYLRLPAMCGVDLPLLAVRAALGEEPESPGALGSYEDGVRYVAPTVLLKCVLAETRARGLRSAISTAREGMQGAGHMLRELLSDPVPIITRSLVPKRPCPVLPIERVPSGGAA